MQRYFITAESTYEDLRQALNAQLAYPNALGKTVFQTALQAPRDGFRRVLLAVDTDLPNYAAIAASIAPLTDSDAMEEIDEATYLAAVASATAGASAWNDITGKPTSFDPSSHASSHGSAGSDPVTVAVSQVTGLQTALDGKAAASHAHTAADVTAGVFDVARLPVGQTSTTVAAGNDARFTDARTPLAHVHSGADITSGTVDAARLGQHASTHQTGGSDAVTNVVVSPSQITGNQNDYSPGTGDIVRLSSDAARNITGVTAGASGEVRVLVNVGSHTITLVHQSASSTAANRFLVSFAADYLLAANAAAVIVYDGTTSRWRVI